MASLAPSVSLSFVRRGPIRPSVRPSVFLSLSAGNIAAVVPVSCAAPVRDDAAVETHTGVDALFRERRFSTVLYRVLTTGRAV